MKKLESVHNSGMYSDEKVANEWMEWVRKFDSEKDDTRYTSIYPWLTSWIKNNSPKNILEIGSGTGLCSEKIDLGTAEYLGIEPSSYLREFASKNYTDRKFVAGIAEELPLEDGCFDAIFSVFVWLHISDIHKAAKELSRVLKPGGKFAIVTANPDTYSLWLSWYDDPKINGKQVLGQMAKLSNHEMFLHSMDDIKASITGNGLVIDEIKDCMSRKEITQAFAIIISGHKTL